MSKIILFILLISNTCLCKPVKLSVIEKLGKDLFFDEQLSVPSGQSCATCHKPQYAFASQGEIVSQGAVLGRFGNRNVPSISYAFKTPQFHREFENQKMQFVGGMFLDGRANNMIAQVKGPLLNPLEMNNKDEKSVIDKVIASGYKKRFARLFGEKVFDNDKRAFKFISLVLVAYENSSEFGLFNSKYDLFLRGKIELTDQELLGLKIFEDDKKGHCSSCHLSKVDKARNYPLFTEFDYDNIGVPKNANNPFYTQDKIYNVSGLNYRDKGLGQTLNNKLQDGKFRVPTLRNIELTAPYMHNGVFETLKQVIDFYNTRDIDSKWQSAEISENVNKDEMGNLGLSEIEISALIAFLKTLTDNYQQLNL